MFKFDTCIHVPEHKHVRKVRHPSDVSIQEEKSKQGERTGPGLKLSEVNRARERGSEEEGSL